MLVYLLYLLIGWSFFCTYGKPCIGGASTTVEQIHLSLEDEFNTCVMWNSSQKMEQPTVWYFKGKCTPEKEWTSVYGTQRHYPSGGFLYVAKLVDLDSDSTYCYSIGDRCEYSERIQFRTSSPNKATFAALSDAGTLGNVTRVMKNLASDSDVTLVLHPGDLSYGLTEAVWDKFGKIVEPVAREKPYMVIPGNWDVKDAAIQSFVNRYTMPLVTQPSQPSTLPLSYYYSFNYSVFHIVMLSSYDPYNSTTPQYKWLEHDLERASKDREKHPWIVVCVHSPMYSSNSGHGGGDTAFRVVVEPILVKFRVDLVLTGHDHGYERSYPVNDNVIYDLNLNYYHFPNAPIHILVGTAGATLDAWLAQPTWSAHREPSCGYTKITASHHSLHVVFLTGDNQIGDQFEISRVTLLPLRYIMLVGLVILFAVLPLLLYKGLPDPIRNYLLCQHDISDDVTISTSKFI